MKSFVKYILISIMPLLFARWNPVLAAEQEIKIGAVLGLSGAAAEEGTGFQKGILLAAEDLKAKGRIVEVSFEDDQTNSLKTVNAIEQMKARGIRLFIGPTWGFQVKAARATIEQGGLVALSPATTSDYAGSSESIFHLCPSRKTQLPVLVPWLKQNGIRRAFLVNLSTDWGEVHKTLFSRALKEAGAEVVGTTQIEFGTDLSTFQSILAKVRQTRADLIMMTASANEYANLIKAQKHLHMNIRVLGDENIFGLFRSNLIPSRSEAGEIFSLSPVVSSEFVKRFHDRFNEYPSLHADRAYDAVMIFADTAAGTNGDPAQIRNLLRGGASFKGYSGTISFDENGDVSQGDYRVFAGEHPWD